MKCNLHNRYKKAGGRKLTKEEKGRMYQAIKKEILRPLGNSKEATELSESIDKFMCE